MFEGAVPVTPSSSFWFRPLTLPILHGRNALKLFIVLLIILLATLLALDSFGPQHCLSLIQTLNHQIQDAGDLGILWIVILLTMVTMSGAPASYLIVGGGYVFTSEYGTGLGFGINVGASFIGCLIGSIASFYLGKFILKRTFQKYIQSSPKKTKKISKTKKLLKAVQKSLISPKQESNDALTLSISLRLVPYIPWSLINYTAGIIGMDLRVFVQGSGGMVPWIVACTLMGSGLKSLDEATSSGSSDDDDDQSSNNDDDGADNDGDQTLNLVTFVFGVVFSIITSVMVTRFAKRALLEMEDEEEEEIRKSLVGGESPIGRQKKRIDYAEEEEEDDDDQRRSPTLVADRYHAPNSLSLSPAEQRHRGSSDNVRHSSTSV
jgi:uncharacterized membrane protein YdjX (TVP38/TMEM64 family)